MLHSDIVYTLCKFSISTDTIIMPRITDTLVAVAVKVVTTAAVVVVAVVVVVVVVVVGESSVGEASLCQISAFVYTLSQAVRESMTVAAVALTHYT